ncbi:MAG: family 78 glycoside hydrolase catalytic domain [Bacteroidetes bacterium]|nr:family 78 glycoside hydrolase catalytic domain [Bacteroidota bacterium]
MKMCLLSMAFALISISGTAQLVVSETFTENSINPIGLAESKPRFSWKLNGSGRNLMQTAYEIRVGDALAKVKDGNIWKSGKTISSTSQFIEYGGVPLQSGTYYFWQVRVWDGNNKPSEWSKPSFWQTALLNDGDWKATWIRPGYEEDTINRPSPLMRKTFKLKGKVASATAYITALGLYEAFINGKRVGDAFLTPGWTSYNNRLQYQQYDVTGLLNGGGENAIGVMLGSGWYRGNIGFSRQQNFYGKEIALLFQMQVRYADGTSETVVSDGTWTTSTGAIRSSEIYHGEMIDARMEIPGWSRTGNPSGTWTTAKTGLKKSVNLVATYNEPIRKHEIFKPVKFIITPKGEKVLDFGQNLVGWVTMKVSGNAGDRIEITHAEVLDKKGNFYTENLRPAKQRNVFILAGKGEETFEPHFTFQGFRYIKIEGYPGSINPDHFYATALYSDMRPTGKFVSSHPLVNQLQHNIQWGQRGNFLDVPTDCPQRDERLGWTGDAQAFARTATFNFDVHNFFSKWLKDVAFDQIEGSVPFVVPNVLGPGASGSAGWADAATIIPWAMYQAYGDRRILEDQYESMKAWVGFMQKKSTNDLWNTGFHFGDWLFYRPFDDNDGRSAVTDKYLIAQCFFAHSTELVIKTARVLGKEKDIAEYSALLERVRNAFRREYLTPGGRLVSGTQTAWVLALQFNMLPEDMRQHAADRLAENIKSYGNHLTTGFLGTPYLCHVLSKYRYTDLAYTLLLQETYPSWLYPVKMGATTIWERWDGIKPDSTFQTPGMNSFNHYAYGAIGDWMYRVAAGIDTEESNPGYKSIVITPHTGKGLDRADATLETPYGKARSAWTKVGTGLQLEVEIPVNTTAKIRIPTSNAAGITEGNKKIQDMKELKVKTAGNGYTELEIGSGTYVFKTLDYTNQ